MAFLCGSLAAEEPSVLFRWLVCSYISDLSNHQLPQLCCLMDSKAPNAHLVCVLNSRLGEGSWKAMEEKRSVLAGMAGSRGSAASWTASWLAGRRSTEQNYMDSRGRGWGTHYSCGSWPCCSHSCVPRAAGCQTPEPAEQPVHPTAQQQCSAVSCWGVQAFSTAAPGLAKATRHHHSREGPDFVIRAMSVSQVKPSSPV